jgi:DNA-binding transcriptional regulator YiaG
MSKYKNEIYEAIHQDAIADYEVGAISEAKCGNTIKCAITG